MTNNARSLGAALLPFAAVALIACSMPERHGSDREQQSSSPAMAPGAPMMGMNRMMSGGMMGGNMAEMRSIRGLLTSHESIDRTVQDLPNGVRTVTVSDHPQVTELIRTHVRQMRDRYERDQPIRGMDPLFRELFERRHEARL